MHQKNFSSLVGGRLDTDTLTSPWRLSRSKRHFPLYPFFLTPYIRKTTGTSWTTLTPGTVGLYFHLEDSTDFSPLSLFFIRQSQ